MRRNAEEQRARVPVPHSHNHSFYPLEVAKNLIFSHEKIESLLGLLRPAGICGIFYDEIRILETTKIIEKTSA